MINLTGKVVLVTGASRGIGAAIARTLGACGAEVVAHYSASREAAESVAASIGRDRCQLVQGELGTAGIAKRVWDDAVAWRGRVDVLVNNAAIALSVPFDAEPAAWDDAWMRTLRVNLVAVADLCRAAVEHYRSRGGGIVINIASRAAFRGDEPDYIQYAASKGGMIALTKSLARGFARDGVIAYAVAPGWVSTDMADQAVTARGMSVLTRDIPMGAFAPPSDVANVVAFLASGLAPHATGTTIDINGASYVR
jgi:3-oxoacyl-[acyl-carrier protein] reductase